MNEPAPERDLELINAIYHKLKAHAAILAKSPYGRITFRRMPQGGYEIHIETRL